MRGKILIIGLFLVSLLVLSGCVEEEIIIYEYDSDGNIIFERWKNINPMFE